MKKIEVELSIIKETIATLQEAKKMYETIEPTGDWQRVYEAICDTIAELEIIIW